MIDGLFRLPGGVKRAPEVEAWLSDQPPDVGAIAIEWVERMRQCGDDVVELLHDGGAVACVGEAAFAYVNAYKSHVNVGFYRGADLDDPSGLLEGKGKRMRHVQVKPGAEIDATALGALLVAAYADIKSRLRNDSA